MDRFICIHGHFYQPPRENPWLEAIEVQDSAYPFHDWNERISEECYAANAASRILSGYREIVEIVNNYSRISFNFGPTLLSWLQEKRPETYQAILRADQQSQQNFSGHGSAIAQVYNHIIMPLASRRDKYTQIRWGIADFQHRFGRMPEGLWLSETAVDLESLDIMAELGIKFTILSPYQAGYVREIGVSKWRDATHGRIDPKIPYLQTLPSGRTIALFFYDGPISRAIAFEGLLSSGERLADRLVGAFTEDSGERQLVHIATDGETYGHHHKKGDMALAYALEYIEKNNLARVTNYGEYLELCPPAHEVDIVEQTAWSCFHGIGRWKEDCGCNSGGYPNWNQAWRTPLRDSLDWLRDSLAEQFEQAAAELIADPWSARDDYINVILNRGQDNINQFVSRWQNHPLTDQERVRVLKLMEMQRHTLLMYTSCGWFFDEISGLETVQVIQYAGRAVQLAQELFNDGTEEGFQARLALAKSNLPEHGDGRQIYEKFVTPTMVDLNKVGAHYALSALFEPYPDQARIYSFNIERKAFHMLETGRSRMVTGNAIVTSTITQETADLSFAAVHFGDHNLSAGVRANMGDATYQKMMREVSNAFERSDMPEVVRKLDANFGSTFSLKTLFRDEQRKILDVIVTSARIEAEALYSQLYERDAPLLRYLASLDIRLPPSLQPAATIALNVRLRQAFEMEHLDLEHIHALLHAADMIGITLDTAGLAYALKQTLERLAAQFRAQPDNLMLLQELESSARLARSLPFEVDMWWVQNVYYDLLLTLYPNYQKRVKQGKYAAQVWAEHFSALGRLLKVQIPRENTETA